MDYSSLRQYKEILESKLVGKRLSRFTQIDTHLFKCKVDKKEDLVFCLDSSNPRIYLCQSTLPDASINSTLATLLRKKFGNALVSEISLINEDRILGIGCTILNDVFKPVQASLILELIPGRTNLILIEEGKILHALHMTTLDHPHPIIKGLQYLPLEHPPFAPKEINFIEEKYIYSCLENEAKILYTSRQKKFKPLYLYAKKLEKSAKNRQILIQQDIEEAKTHLEDADIGRMILTYGNESPIINNQLDIFGQRISIDPQYSLVENAERYFKKYKKAKATITASEANLKRAEDDLKKAHDIQLYLEFADDDFLETLLKSITSKSSKSSVDVSAYLPYLITYQGKRIYFGKNASQNDFLTFHFLHNKLYYWFHVKDTKGAHVVIEDDHPSNELIEFCCEIALLATSLTSGEVQYCPRKALRKGKVPGQVILSSYQSAFIRNIKNEAKMAFSCQKRILENQ